MSCCTAIIAICFSLICTSIAGTPSDFFPFSGGNYKRQPSGNGDDGSYYEALGQGMNKLSNVDEIKKAYRKKAMLLHPDKGGDAEDFKCLTEAYEILSNPQKRAIYDRYGMAGLSGDGGSRSSASDMAREFFKGFGGFSAPLLFQLDLSLEDFYLGKDITIPIDSTQQVKVVVEPGMFGGQELIAQAEYRGMARDIILRLREVRHPIFLRKNADLLIDLKITLIEALLGFNRTIMHLDGSEVTFQSPLGDVSSPDTVFILPGYGMPVYQDLQKTRGRLFIRTKLEMPKSTRLLTLDDKRQLERLLNIVDVNNSLDSRFQDTEEADESTQVKASGYNKIEGANGKVDLISADIRSFGQFGGVSDEDDDDFQRSPFAQYFFR